MPITKLHTRDEEEAVKDDRRSETPIVGHPAAAAFIARDPDHETYVFRSFNSLAARNLLYLQGELVELEGQLTSMDREAAEGTDPISLVSLRSWRACNDTAKWRETERQRHELAELIEWKLRKYRMSILPVESKQLDQESNIFAKRIFLSPGRVISLFTNIVSLDHYLRVIRV